MEIGTTTASAWIDGFVEMLDESFKAGESGTLRGFGSCYVREARRSWAFRFTPGQRLGAVLGWSLSNKGRR